MFRFPIFCGEVFTYPHAFGDCETAGLRDCGTTRPRDCGTTRQRDRATTAPRSAPPHVAGLPARTNPQYATPLTLRVIFRAPTP